MTKIIKIWDGKNFPAVSLKAKSRNRPFTKGEGREDYRGALRKVRSRINVSGLGNETWGWETLLQTLLRP